MGNQIAAFGPKAERETYQYYDSLHQVERTLLSDEQNTRTEHDKALERVIVEMLTDNTELFKQFMDNPDFNKWLSDTIFGVTYKKKSA